MFNLNYARSKTNKVYLITILLTIYFLSINLVSAQTETTQTSTTTDSGVSSSDSTDTTSTDSTSDSTDTTSSTTDTDSTTSDSSSADTTDYTTSTDSTDSPSSEDSSTSTDDTDSTTRDTGDSTTDSTSSDTSSTTSEDSSSTDDTTSASSTGSADENSNNSTYQYNEEDFTDNQDFTDQLSEDELEDLTDENSLNELQQLEELNNQNNESLDDLESLENFESLNDSEQILQEEEIIEDSSIIEGELANPDQETLEQELEGELDNSEYLNIEDAGIDGDTNSPTDDLDVDDPNSDVNEEPDFPEALLAEEYLIVTEEQQQAKDMLLKQFEDTDYKSSCDKFVENRDFILSLHSQASKERVSRYERIMNYAIFLSNQSYLQDLDPVKLEEVTRNLENRFNRLSNSYNILVDYYATIPYSLDCKTISEQDYTNVMIEVVSKRLDAKNLAIEINDYSLEIIKQEVDTYPKSCVSMSYLAARSCLI